MGSKSRAVLAVLVVAFAFSAVAAGAAQAEPTYYHEGAAITKAFNVRYRSGRTRLWLTNGGTVITCENDNGIGTTTTGTITTKGEGTGTGPRYTECKLREASHNTTTKRWEEGKEISACSVKTPGAVLGELDLGKEMKSKLVYRAGTTEKELLVLLEPKLQPMFVLEIGGSACFLKETVSIGGNVLSAIPRVNEEAIMSDSLFETINEKTEGEFSELRSRFTEYELGGVKTTGVGLTGLRLVVESTVQIELEPVGGKRGLFGAHT